MTVNRHSWLGVAVWAFMATLMVIVLVSQPAYAAGSWYVAPGGSDSNTCLSAVAPCATINGALGKPDFVASDTVLVATGTYTGTGTEVVSLNISTTLSGGWDSAFITQIGTSTIDGQGARRGMGVNSGVTAVLEYFVVRNSANDGIDNFGTLTLNNSTVSGNTGGGNGGIYNSFGTVTLNNSTVSGNIPSGIFNNNGTVTLNNSTVSGNTGQSGMVGGGIYNEGTLALNNSTISGNSGPSGGIYTYGTVTLRNSILAGNTSAEAGPDCSGPGPAISSSGYNLIGNTSGCTFTPGTGDLTNVNAHLGQLIGSPGYYPLLSGSPAIDSGNPAGCLGSAGLLTTDQRGAARVGRCDIGAYEYTPPGPAAHLFALSGTPQHALPFSAFGLPLQAAVLDSIGSPVSNTVVTFSAPVSGASGTFAPSGTYTMTGKANASGVATSAIFSANGLTGSYNVTATASGVITPASFLLSNIAWYVATHGNNGNDCQTPATSCATINGVLAKGDFIAGDTVFVASGTYTSSTGSEVVLLNKSVTLSGGWNSGFTAQNGMSTIDGQGARPGLTVSGGVVTVERFTIQNGFVTQFNLASVGGGIYNISTVTLNNSTVSGNTVNQFGSGGIYNGGSLTLNNSTVSGNTDQYGGGGGIYNGGGTVALNNSTVSGNTVSQFGSGGIDNSSGTVTLNNSTVSGNTMGGIDNSSGGRVTLTHSTVSSNTNYGIANEGGGTVTLNNSTVSGNLGSTGIYNGGSLTLTNSMVSGNTGGGIYNNTGTLTLNNSTISGNTAVGFGTGGGILNWNGGTMTLNNSTVSGNVASDSSGGIYNDGTLTLNNSTVSGNTSQHGNGGGISGGTITLNNSTISGNSASSGGGIYIGGGTVTTQNSILAGNTSGGAGPDCNGSMSSSGHNLIGNTAGCTFTLGTGDLTNVDAHLGQLIGSPGYHPLLSGSPAIDAGNPATCLATDQRGVVRPQGSFCDIGAYEYATPGTPASLGIAVGSNQRATIKTVFSKPLIVYVLDSNGSPVSGVTVTFTAPSSGASGTFADSGTGTTTKVSNNGGPAISSAFTANSQPGSYNVTAAASGLTSTVKFSLTNTLPWYVAPTGNDGNTCASPAAPCLTINGALGKPGFVAGDTVLVATGTYTGTGTEVVSLNIGTILSGGWDASFTTQNGMSTIDGESARRGLTVNSDVSAIVTRLAMQHSDVGSGQYGEGIVNAGTLTLNQVQVHANANVNGGGGISNQSTGILTINNSAVTDNGSINRCFGGIVNDGGILNINNSTVSGNASSTVYCAPIAGIANLNGSLSLNNVTIANNTGGGLESYPAGATTLRNTIIAGNTVNGSFYDCNTGDVLNSLGYNLVGVAGCTINWTAGDLTNVDARLFTLIGSPGYLPLLPGSPAINAGSPAGCTDNLGKPLTTDQRGVARVGRCDIGAYEFDPNNNPIKQVFLPAIFRNYCAPFSDNFSNPASGWPIGDDGQFQYEYLNGEYRILVRPTDSWAGARPGVKCSDYTVAVDVRNATSADGTAGLIFGLSDDWQQFYTFEIRSDGYYYLWRYSGGNWTLLLSGQSANIHTGTSTNRIKIERVGAQIKAYANNQLLINTSDGTYIGARHVGLIVSSNTQPNMDARFDNFVMCAPGCSGAASLSGVSAASSRTVNRPPLLSTEVARGTSGSKITRPSVPFP